jgi:hypothetical protein
MISEIPSEFALLGNHPNPFNPSTTITFQLPVASEVTLTVFDINGRHVEEDLMSTRHFNPGIHSITFDGTDLPSGIYIYRLNACNFKTSGKLVLLK